MEIGCDCCSPLPGPLLAAVVVVAVVWWCMSAAGKVAGLLARLRKREAGEMTVGRCCRYGAVDADDACC